MWTVRAQENTQTSSSGRSTYESLTEKRGSFLLKQQLKEKNQQKNASLPQESKKSASTQPTAVNTTPSPSSVKNFTQTNIENAPPLLDATDNSGPIINFNNVNIAEVLKYMSRLTGKNFLYDPNELQFNITMISETPTTLKDLMAMLLQSLQIHGYVIAEQDNGFVIHANPTVKSIAKVQPTSSSIEGPQITTQVFNLQNTPADKCAVILKAMASESAIVEMVSDSKVVVSDIAENILKISEIIKRLDLETSSLEIGQYVVINSSPFALATLAQRIVSPIAANKAFLLVPHSGSNSIYIVSTPYLVEKTLGILQMVDLSRQKSGLLSDENYKFDSEVQEEALRHLLDEQQKGSTSSLNNLTREDIEAMPLEMVQAELMKRGYTLEEVLALPPHIARSLLWQLISNERESRLRSLNQRLDLGEENMPLGRTESTHFYIHKLQYRKASDVAVALRSIATSMSGTTQGQESIKTSSAPTASLPTAPSSDIMQSDLLLTLNSLQPIDDNNIIVFTGTRASIEKIKELISQIDLPVRQVFLEVLFLQTTLSDSLNFGVEWGGEIVGRNFGTQIGFTNPGNSPFGTAFNQIGITDENKLIPGHIMSPPPLALPRTGGFSSSAIGRKVKFHGRGFRSTGALVNALQSDNEVHILINPKIVVEHNVAAEIFVGKQIPIKGQSIVNATSSTTQNLVTSNYETQNVGTSLKVTPLISSKDTVTLIIEQKISNASQAQVNSQGGQDAPPATINETRTSTRVHLPSDHFLVLSGMINEQLTVKKDMIPCLGGLPIIGSLFGNKLDSTDNQNLLMFIRPIIIDTPADIDEITKNQEKSFKEKSKVYQGWNKQLDTGKMILNLEPQ